MRTRVMCGLWPLLFWLGSGPVLAGPAQTLGLVPDSSCRSSKLVVPFETALSAAVQGDGITPVREAPEKARLVLQYYLMVHKQAGEQVVVQVDGQVLGARGGKVLASGSARSDALPGDEAGQQKAAEQAGARLAEQLKGPLLGALQESGRGRRVLLQVTLEGPAQAARQEVLGKLKRALAAQLVQVQSSSDTHLMLVLKTADPPRQVAEDIDRALQGMKTFEGRWVVKAQASMLLTLGAPPAGKPAARSAP